MTEINAKTITQLFSVSTREKPKGDYEKMQFYYHPDHLGSSSYITNLDGEVSQHIEYVPFGEVFIDELELMRKSATAGKTNCNNTWNTAYRFNDCANEGRAKLACTMPSAANRRVELNAKEFDEETGMYYYGARYYEPKLSLWMSVDIMQEKYPNVSSYVYCINNPIILIDSDGKDIYPILFQTTDNRGWANGTPYRSNKKYMEAMRMFGQTNYGRLFIGAFLKKNQSQYGVNGNGKYSKYRFRIEEYEMKDAHDHFVFMPNLEGSFSAKEIDGKLNIILRLDVKGKTASELVETISHELALHGSDIDKIISAYEKGGIEALQKLFTKDPNGDMDHISLAKQDNKHVGVSNYNQVKRELIKRYPSTKKEFDKEQRKYEGEFGK